MFFSAYSVVGVGGGGVGVVFGVVGNVVAFVVIAFVVVAVLSCQLLLNLVRATCLLQKLPLHLQRIND